MYQLHKLKFIHTNDEHEIPENSSSSASSLKDISNNFNTKEQITKKNDVPDEIPVVEKVCLLDSSSSDSDEEQFIESKNEILHTEDKTSSETNKDQPQVFANNEKIHFNKNDTSSSSSSSSSSSEDEVFCHLNKQNSLDTIQTDELSNVIVKPNVTIEINNSEFLPSTIKIIESKHTSSSSSSSDSEESINIDGIGRLTVHKSSVVSNDSDASFCINEINEEMKNLEHPLSFDPVFIDKTIEKKDFEYSSSSSSSTSYEEDSSEMKKETLCPNIFIIQSKSNPNFEKESDSSSSSDEKESIEINNLSNNDNIAPGLQIHHKLNASSYENLYDFNVDQLPRMENSSYSSSSSSDESNDSLEDTLDRNISEINSQILPTALKASLLSSDEEAKKLKSSSSSSSTSEDENNPNDANEAIKLIEQNLQFHQNSDSSSSSSGNEIQRDIKEINPKVSDNSSSDEPDASLETQFEALLSKKGRITKSQTRLKNRFKDMFKTSKKKSTDVEKRHEWQFIGSSQSQDAQSFDIVGHTDYLTKKIQSSPSTSSSSSESEELDVNKKSKIRMQIPDAEIEFPKLKIAEPKHSKIQKISTSSSSSSSSSESEDLEVNKNSKITVKIPEAETKFPELKIAQHKNIDLQNICTSSSSDSEELELEINKNSIIENKIPAAIIPDQEIRFKPLNKECKLRIPQKKSTSSSNSSSTDDECNPNEIELKFAALYDSSQSQSNEITMPNIQTLDLDKEMPEEIAIGNFSILPKNYYTMNEKIKSNFATK